MVPPQSLAEAASMWQCWDQRCRRVGDIHLWNKAGDSISVPRTRGFIWGIHMLDPPDGPCSLVWGESQRWDISPDLLHLLGALSAFYFPASSLRTRCILIVFLPPGSECWDHSRHRRLILEVSGQALLFSFKVYRNNCSEGAFIYVSTVIGFSNAMSQPPQPSERL